MTRTKESPNPFQVGDLVAFPNYGPDVGVERESYAIVEKIVGQYVYVDNPWNTKLTRWHHLFLARVVPSFGGCVYVSRPHA